MKKTQTQTLRMLSFLAVVSFAHGAVIQTVAGPIASGGGAGNVLIDTTNDTGDWITSLNAGGTVYLSWDWTIDNNAGETGAGGFFGGIGVYDGGTERLLLGNGWNELTYSAGAGPGIEDTGTAYVVDATVKLVAELTVVEGGNDTWKMWVNPSSPSAPADIQRTDWVIDNFTQLTHRAGNGTGAATLANLVVAENFSDVVPEPSTSSLMILGGLALMRRRRK